jgi:hypothetical protein
MSSMQRNYCRNFKVTEANRRRGPGTREKVSSRRINLECNTFVHGSNARNLPVYLSLSQLPKTLCFIIVYTLSSRKREGQNRFCLEVGGMGGVAQKCMHI